MEMARRFQPAGGIVFGQLENRPYAIKAILMKALGRKARPGAGIQRCKAATAGFGA
jgi:hypothetical protein